MGPEPLPPGSGGGIQRADDDGAAGCLLVELDGGGKHVSRERGSDSEVGVAAVDREPAKEERWHWLRCTFPKRFRRGGSVDAGHGDARAGHDEVIGVCDHQRRGSVSASVLTRPAPQPLVEDRLSAVELAATVSARVQRRRAAQLSQAS